jgi:hypothetical protein
LWPVIAEEHESDVERPRQSGELSPEPVEDIDKEDAASVMQAIWTDWVTPHEHEDELTVEDFEELEPFSRRAWPHPASRWRNQRLQPSGSRVNSNWRRAPG